MWSDGSIHSLAATAAFGDFNEAALSRPINGWILEHINAARLKYAWVATDTVRGQVVFTVPINTSTNNNHHLVMDYRFDPPRWSRLNAFDSGAVARVVDSNIPQIFSGGNDGYVRKINRSGRTIDTGAAISFDTTTPFISYSTPHNMKVFERGSLGLTPLGADWVADFYWTRDNNNSQMIEVTQGGSGTPLGSFILGTSRLGGSRFQQRFFSCEEGGEFRTIQYSVRNGKAGEDIELHNIGATIGRGADSGENF